MTIKRNTPLPRRSAPLRKTRPRAVNKQRKAKNWTRAYGSKARVEWVKAQQCLLNTPRCDGPTENAHVGNDGMGRKASAAHIVPLCRFHHRHQHTIGTPAFEEAYGISLAWWAENTEGRWQSYCTTQSPTQEK